MRTSESEKCLQTNWGPLSEKLKASDNELFLKKPS